MTIIEEIGKMGMMTIALMGLLKDKGIITQEEFDKVLSDADSAIKMIKDGEA